MKTSASKLRFYANQVASDYLSNNNSMDDSIVKIAQDAGLNKHQVHRVVEQANQKVYLTLFDKGSDKYAAVNFDIANLEAILGRLSMKKSANHVEYLDDYTIAPEPVEKVANDETKAPHRNFYNEYLHLEKRAEDIRTQAGQNQLLFNKEFETFSKLAKQLILTNKLKFEELNSAFPVDFIDKVASHSYLKNTGEYLPAGEFCVNDKHPLMQSFNKLSELEDVYLDLYKQAMDLHAETTKVAEDASASTMRGTTSLIEGVAADIAKAWRVIKEVPAKHLVGYPAAFLLGVMFQKSKEQNARETLTSDDVPLIFRTY